MKFAVKNLLLIAALAAVFMNLSGCRTAENADLPKGDYPLAPAAITEAELTKTDGADFKIADYKGKVVLVNLWATWCGPCKAEMPELVKMQDEYRNKGFEVIGLNIDEAEDAELIREFGEKMNLNYQLAKGEHELGYEFIKISKMDAIPQSFLIDREGRLVGVYTGVNKAILEKLRTNVERFTAS